MKRLKAPRSTAGIELGAHPGSAQRSSSLDDRESERPPGAIFRIGSTGGYPAARAALFNP